MAKEKDKNYISTKLAELEKVVRWFEEQKELDLEEGLKKIKEGASIAKELKDKLKKTENEFTEIKKELEKEA